MLGDAPLHDGRVHRHSALERAGGWPQRPSFGQIVATRRAGPIDKTRGESRFARLVLDSQTSVI